MWSSLAEERPPWPGTWLEALDLSSRLISSNRWLLLITSDLLSQTLHCWMGLFWKKVHQTSINKLSHPLLTGIVCSRKDTPGLDKARADENWFKNWSPLIWGNRWLVLIRCDCWLSCPPPPVLTAVTQSAEQASHIFLTMVTWMMRWDGIDCVATAPKTNFIMAMILAMKMILAMMTLVERSPSQGPVIIDWLSQHKISHIFLRRRWQWL